MYSHKEILNTVKDMTGTEILNLIIESKGGNEGLINDIPLSLISNLEFGISGIMEWISENK